MPNDFPIATTSTGIADLTTGEVATTGVAVIDLDDMAANITPTVIDPTIPNVESDDPSRPATASPTTGPHRFTVVVPNKGGNSENSILNVGQGGPSTRIQDTGITGMTKTHIHWHTKDAPQTMVLLGGPTAHHGWAGPNGADNPKASSGYMVVTEGKAWQESRGHQYLLSKDGDAVLRSAAAGKRVVIQADGGEVDLIAKTNLYVVSPGISIIAPAAVTPETGNNYDGKWEGKQPKADGAKPSKNVITVMAAAVSAHDIVRKFAKSFKKNDEGKTKFSMGAWYDHVKWGADAVKFGLTVPKIIGMFSSPEPKPGCVKINGEADVGILAGGEVSAFGTMGFSAGAAMWTSVSAGLSASFKALVFTGVGGAITSLKGYKKIEVGSDYGEVIIKAAKDLNVTAEKNAMIGAKKTAQLTSEGKTLVSAISKVVVGAGDGAGFGAVAQTNRIMIGKLDKSDTIDAKGNEKALIVVRDDSLRCVLKQSRLQLDEGEALLRAQAIKLSAESGGNVTVNGAKILLG